MRISEKGLNFIKSFEGFSPVVYRDLNGIPTIGVGHAVRRGEVFDKPLTEAEALDILARDVKSAEGAVMRLVRVPLTQNQFDALVDFVFNLGSGKFQASTLCRRINRREGGERGQFMRWVFAAGRKVEGLVRRREAEANLYLT